MLNQQRLAKVITDMSETIGLIEECMTVIETREEDKTSLFVVFGLKQLFVDYFITVEDFVSMMLKDKKRFQIGIDMKQSLEILKAEQVIDENLHLFLNEARLFRNRIAHRYKEPSREELLEFVTSNKDYFEQVLVVLKQHVVINE